MIAAQQRSARWPDHQTGSAAGKHQRHCHRTRHCFCHCATCCNNFYPEKTFSIAAVATCMLKLSMHACTKCLWVLGKCSVLKLPAERGGWAVRINAIADLRAWGAGQPECCGEGCLTSGGKWRSSKCCGQGRRCGVPLFKLPSFYSIYRPEIQWHVSALVWEQSKRTCIVARADEIVISDQG